MWNCNSLSFVLLIHVFCFSSNAKKTYSWDCTWISLIPLIHAFCIILNAWDTITFLKYNYIYWPYTIIFWDTNTFTGMRLHLNDLIDSLDTSFCLSLNAQKRIDSASGTIGFRRYNYYIFWDKITFLKYDYSEDAPQSHLFPQDKYFAQGQMKNN